MKLNVPYKNVGSVPLSLVEESLALIKPEHWLVDETRNKMGNLEHTQSIILRYFDNYNSSILPDWKNRIVNKKLQPIYQQIIDKFLFELKKYYKFNEYMVFFAKLLPYCNVGLHVDSGEFLETCNRIHIPLQTNKDVFYVIENNDYNWILGNIYEFDNTRIHGVKNNSDKDRIHLMFNLYE